MTEPLQRGTPEWQDEEIRQARLLIAQDIRTDIIFHACRDKRVDLARETLAELWDDTLQELRSRTEMMLRFIREEEARRRSAD